MSQPVDLIITSRWMAPQDDAYAALLEDYGLAVKAGKIVACLPQEELLESYSAPEQVSLDDHLLIPGFINAHTHAAMNLLKGYANDLPLMTWLQEHIWPAEGQLLSDEFVYQGTQLAIAEMLKSGTTCFNEMYFMPGQVAQAALDIGIRASIGMTVIEFPTAWAKDANEYFSKGLAVFDQFKGEDSLRFTFAPHAPYTVGDESLKRIATLAQELDLNIHMHIHETAHEVQEAIEKTGERPLARLHQLGLLSPSLQAVHMTQIDEQDLRLVSDNGVHIMHCPESNMKLASGFCPVSQFKEAGVNIAIGTDGCASNNDLDMIGEMRSAALLAKVSSQKADSFSAQEALYAATMGGAKALGIDHVCGSITVGKSADLCAVNLNHIATMPTFDPVAQLVYSASRDQITHVWTSGKAQVKNGMLTEISESDCQAICEQWKPRLLALQK